MKFVIRKVFPSVDDDARWEWVYAKADMEVARSPRYYPSERDARTSIAAAKRAMQAARFAKVVAE